MLEANVALCMEPIVQYFCSGKAVPIHLRGAFSQAYSLTCKDGRRIGLHMSSPDKFWHGLCRVLGRQDWIQTYPKHSDRVNAYEFLAAELNRVFQTRERAEWAAALERESRRFLRGLVSNSSWKTRAAWVAALGQGNVAKAPPDGYTLLFGSERADRSSIRIFIPRWAITRLATLRLSRYWCGRRITWSFVQNCQSHRSRNWQNTHASSISPTPRRDFGTTINLAGEMLKTRDEIRHDCTSPTRAFFGVLHRRRRL